MFKTHIEKVKGDWKEVLNDCRFTVNLKEIDKEPSEKFKKEILIAEHSPIRNISIKWRWLQIPPLGCCSLGETYMGKVCSNAKG